MMVETNSRKSVVLNIPFASTDTAYLVHDVLGVDKELKSSGVLREISVIEENLHIKIDGPDLKKIRVAVNSIIKSILLIIKTIDMFPKSM